LYTRFGFCFASLQGKPPSLGVWPNFKTSLHLIGRTGRLQGVALDFFSLFGSWTFQSFKRPVTLFSLRQVSEAERIVLLSGFIRRSFISMAALKFAFFALRLELASAVSTPVDVWSLPKKISPGFSKSDAADESPGKIVPRNPA